MNSAAIDKIKKLLRLSRCTGASPGEAATALQKALKLAADHGIDLAKLPADDGEGGGMTHTTEQSTKGVAQQLASGLVKHHFGVDTLFDSTRGQRRIHFIGMEENCHLAAYCYVYLVRAMNAAWRNRQNRRLRDRVSFLRGYARAIDQAMPAVFHQPGLVVSANAYIETVLFAGRPGMKLIELKPRKAGGGDAAALHGYVAGKHAGIRNALRGTDKPLIG